MFWAIIKTAIMIGLLVGMWRAFMRGDGRMLRRLAPAFGFALLWLMVF